MTNFEDNPWDVNYLDEFLYYCCPECNERSQSKDLFVQHALNQHPKAKVCIPRLAIKEEPIQEMIYDENDIYENYNNDTTYLSDDVKLEDVKSEVSDEGDHIINDLDRYTCDICNKSLSGSSALKKHMAIAHEGVKSNKCELCEKS